MLIDYHIHNQFSPDSDEKTSEIVKKSIEKGIQEICITNHVELYNLKDSTETFSFEEATNRFNKIKKDIDEVQINFPNLPIKFGVEIEFREVWANEIKHLIDDMNFDFTIGSVHTVDNVVIATQRYAHKLYEKITEEEAYNKYFDKLYKLIEWGEFDIVGHFDINKRYGYRFYGVFKPEKYKNKIIPILELMAKKGIGIELNTNSMKERCCELFPHSQILRWALKSGVEHYTLGSDAHKAKDVGRHLKEALKIAKDIGIKTISTYRKGIPTKHLI